MLKETFTYKDFNGVERKEDYWFHLSKAEVMEMEMSVVGGMSEMLQKVIDAQDAPVVIQTFKDIILKSYGEKSADGRRFMKVDENGRPLSIAFSQTEVFSIILMRMFEDPKYAAHFMEGILPDDLVEKAEAVNESN